VAKFLFLRVCGDPEDNLSEHVTEEGHEITPENQAAFERPILFWISGLVQPESVSDAFEQGRELIRRRLGAQAFFDIDGICESQTRY
jgi:hypothetical protein